MYRGQSLIVGTVAVTVTVVYFESKLGLILGARPPKVLFANVRKDVVDFLFSLLCLPIGSLSKLITDESTFGTLCNTYLSWEQLYPIFLSKPRMAANSFIPVISPTSPFNFALLLCSASPVTAQEKPYRCRCNHSFSYVRDNVCNRCLCTTNIELLYVGSGVPKAEVERDGYVKDSITYAVMDDLSIVPMMSFGSMGFLKKMGYNNLSLFEEKTVSLDIQQGLELLKTSLKSKNVLTDMFLAQKK
ncbi:uncharacterized protein LOC144564493 [Carex rostrata]